MSGHNGHRHKHNKKLGGKSFLILPIIFCFGILLIMYAAVSLTLGPIRSAAGIVFSDAEKDYSTEYKNIYVPVNENETVDMVTNKDGKSFIKADKIAYPKYGYRFGELSIPDCKVECPLFMGDAEVALGNGAGVYYGSFIPGYGGTILIAGHNNTFFNGLKNAKAGQEIILKTSYGNYRYKIRETAVKDSLDTTAYDLSADYENLVLYTCYPFDEVGLTGKRLFVYADLTDGIPIEKN